MRNTCDPSPDFLINIWSNSSEGTPGSVLQSTTLLGVSQTATTNMIGGPTGWQEYSYNASIPGFDLSAATTYWLEIQETSANLWGLGVGKRLRAPPRGRRWNGLIQQFVPPIDSTSWCSLPEQLAFELVGRTST